MARNGDVFPLGEAVALPGLAQGAQVAIFGLEPGLKLLLCGRAIAGVGRDVAKAAAAAVVDEEELDTAGAIERLAKKKLASMGDLDVFVKRRRVFGFLARKAVNPRKTM